MLLHYTVEKIQELWKRTMERDIGDLLVPYMYMDLPEEKVTLDRCGEQFLIITFWLVVVHTIPAGLLGIEVTKILTRHAKHIRIKSMKLRNPHMRVNYVDGRTACLHFTGVWEHRARHSRRKWGAPRLDSPLDCHFMLVWKPEGVLNIVI